MDRKDRLGKPVRLLVLAAILAGIPAPPLAVAQEKRVRIIDPSVAAPPPVAPHELERVEPRPPLSPLAHEPEPKPVERQQRFFKPVATAAGLIRAQDQEFALSGIRVVSPEAICDGPGGAWPCGRHARTAFRMWLRGRALDCELDENEAEDAAERTARCLVADTDPAEWLVRHGWARAAPGSPYEAVEKDARSLRRGIHGHGPD